MMPGADLILPNPGPAALPVSYRQGVIIEWNPATCENKVQVGGSGGPIFENLPVLGVAETATYEPGDVVGLHNLGWTLAIIGQLVMPGTPQALDALSFLSKRTFTNTVATNQNTTSASYVDLATVGPTVPNVLIGPSSRCLVIISAGIQITINVPAGVQVNGGDMSFQVLNAGGTEVVAPNSIPSARIGLVTSATVGLTIDDYVSASQQYVLTSANGLTPGAHTFIAKYRADDNTLGATFGQRAITVIPL